MGHFSLLSKPFLNHWLDASEWMLLGFGVLLVIGIVGELKHGMWGRPVRMFELMVLWGVMGELIADGGIFLFSSQLQMISDTENAEARTQAGYAIERAKTLDKALQTTRADLLSKQIALEKEQQKTARAQAGTAKAELALSKELSETGERISVQGPRALLLNSAKIRKDPRITRFRGQAVTIWTCDDGIRDVEKFSTGMMLRHELDIAGWLVTHGYLKCGGMGITMHLSSRASKTTREAADALASVMNTALLLKPPYTVSPVAVVVITAEQKLVPEPSDPDTVVILVNAHFQQ